MDAGCWAFTIWLMFFGFVALTLLAGIGVYIYLDWDGLVPWFKSLFVQETSPPRVIGPKRTSTARAGILGYGGQEAVIALAC